MKQELLADIESEKILLATVLKQGEKIFFEADAIIKDYDLSLPANKFVWSSISQLTAANQLIDIANILVTCNKIDSKLTKLYSIPEYLIHLSELKINSNDITNLCGRIAKYSIVRKYRDEIQNVDTRLQSIDINKPLSDILAAIEEPLFKFTNDLVSNDDTIKITDNLYDYVSFLAATKPDFQGIPTGYPIYDKVIGGGLRKPGVHLIAGRAKAGKSFWGFNIAYNVVNNNIPVLYADTELTPEITMARLAGRASETPIEYIENGKFADDPVTKRKVFESIKSLTNKGLYYHNISGKSHKEWISIFRRWILKHVGFDANGNVKPCLIILDYIKMMDLGVLRNVAEHQYLGQIITDLHNFCIKLNVPILSFVQLNRDGITKEDQGVIAGSDRLIGLCSSCVMFKVKTADDYADDPRINGDRKVIALATRFGPGTQDGEYINLKTDLSRGIILEGSTNLNNRKNKVEVKPINKPKAVNVYESDSDDQIEF